MNAVVTPTIGAVLDDLRAFLILLLPTGVPVIKGIVNRTPMPLPSPGFVVMTVVYQQRMRTNVDSWDMTLADPTQMTMEQGTELHVQLDFYGKTAGDWAAIVSTAFRDSYAVTALAPTCAPLYIDTVQMMPLVDSEQQYEQRWMATAVLQFNPVVTVPQDFADSLKLNLVDVDVEYPA